MEVPAVARRHRWLPFFALFIWWAAGITPAAAQPADLDCSDFASQATAQANLRANPADLHGLDPDADGIACEGNQPPCDTTPVNRPNVTMSPPTIAGPCGATGVSSQPLRAAPPPAPVAAAGPPVTGGSTTQLATAPQPGTAGQPGTARVQPAAPATAAAQPLGAGTRTKETKDAKDAAKPATTTAAAPAAQPAAEQRPAAPAAAPAAATAPTAQRAAPTLAQPAALPRTGTGLQTDTSATVGWVLGGLTLAVLAFSVMGLKVYRRSR